MVWKNRDFDEWNEKKKLIHQRKAPDAIVWEEWRYYVGVNVWNEIGKGMKGNFVRPWIILANDLWWWLVLIAPLTTQFAKNNSRYSFQLHTTQNKKQQWVLLNQIRTIDKKRLSDRRRKRYSLRFVKKIIYLYHHILLKKSAHTTK